MNNKEFPQQANMPYPYPMPYQDNDEIDLVELFRTLWKQKVKIALVTAATTLAAGIYAFTAEEVWTSKAVIDQPKLEEINEYYTVTQQLKRILQKTAIGEVALEPEKITQEVYVEFKRQAESTDLRKEFWNVNNYYVEKIKNKKDLLEKEKFLNELAEENIQLELADGKKILHTSISLSADSAQTARALLEQYLNKINMVVWQDKINELKAVVDLEVAELIHEKEFIKFAAQAYQDNNIKTSENARNIAEKANIKDFNINAIQGNANVDKTDMMFFLGTKALDAQIDNLKNKPLMLPVRYYQIERILTDLRAVSSTRNYNVKSYRYLMSPNEPVKKDKPKRVLILAAGIIVGFIFGIVVVCISNAFILKSKKE
ncbi:MAG: hypothetical protein EOM41_08615 [Bacilli bacterium]|nr:hypothetical protein [Bacilli bacterium]